MERRDFIKMLGIAGTSAAAYTACSNYMQEALAQSTVIDDLLCASADCKPGSLKEIDHVIFLMQENRSFDHFYGTLRGVRGFGDPRPLRLRNGNPVFTQPNGKNDYINPFQARREDGPAGEYRAGDFGTPHDYNDGLSALAGGWNDNWIAAKKQSVRNNMTMVHFDAAKDLPFYTKLIESFTICDRYHCSIHAGTTPNRSYFVSGTGKGYSTNSFFKNFVDDKSRPDWKTYAEHLQELDVDWKCYQNGLSDPPPVPYDQFVNDAGSNMFVRFKNFRDRTAEIRRRAADLTTVLRTDPDKPSQFEQEVADGKLPAVSWMNAPVAFNDHPDTVNGISPHFGEYYVNEILKALAAYPKVWAKTVFIMTYDENDGFFDHVPPPLPPLPALTDVGKVSAGISIPKNADAKNVDAEHMTLPNVDRTKMVGLGNRVPCIIVSPWTVGGRVCSELFDHTSALRFLDTWLAAKGLQPEGTIFENISSWRRAICGDLTSAFDFTRTLDTVAKEGKEKLDAAAAAAKTVPAFRTKAERDDLKAKQARYDDKARDRDIAIDRDKETRLKQDRMQAELLPLGYDFNVFATVTLAAGKPDKLQLTFRNKGRIGVALNVYSYVKADEKRGAWFYALTKAAKTDAPVVVSDEYDLAKRGGKYEFAVHAPNGYLSEFKGDANNANQKLIADIVDVQSADDATKVRFDFGKWPSVNGDLTMINAYTGESVTVAAQTTSVSAATRDGWYDVAFVDKAGTGYLRRYAGHLENGKLSKTDPAIGIRYDVTKRIYDWAGA